MYSLSPGHWQPSFVGRWWASHSEACFIPFHSPCQRRPSPAGRRRLRDELQGLRASLAHGAVGEKIQAARARLPAASARFRPGRRGPRAAHIAAQKVRRRRLFRRR